MAFLKRAVSAAQSINDEGDDNDWDKLSGDAQDWVNAATKAVNADKEPPDFSDVEPAAEAAENEENETVTETKTTKGKKGTKAAETKTIKGKKGAKASETKTTKAKGAETKVKPATKVKGGNGRGRGRAEEAWITMTIDELTAAPDMKYDALNTKLVKAGHEVHDVTVRARMGGIRRVIERLQERKLLRT